MTSDAVNPQAEHYKRIHDEYTRGYFDAESMEFRKNFVYDKIFDIYDFSNLLVADLASSSGFNSIELLKRFPTSKTTGFDISESACADYRKFTQRPSQCLDLTSGHYEGPQADAAVVFGGLHHCVRDLPATFRTIASIVKPGGHFFMFEPNSKCYLEGIRKIWYKKSSYFEETTEAALDHDHIADIASKWFRPIDVVYRGGPAYFLIYNSLLFGLNENWKRRLSPVLTLAERVYNCLPGKFWFPYFIAHWQRRLDT